MHAGDFLILIMLYARVYHITADVQNVPVLMLKYNQGVSVK